MNHSGNICTLENSFKKAFNKHNSLGRSTSFVVFHQQQHQMEGYIWKQTHKPSV